MARPDPAVVALGGLLPSQFEELVFRLGIDAGRLSTPYAPQRQRARELLEICDHDGRAADLLATLKARGFELAARAVNDAEAATP